MSDFLEIQELYESHLFKAACQDVARIVSILAIESDDLRRRRAATLQRSIYEKFLFFMRFFYLIFVKGFTPTLFTMMPFRLWQLLSVLIYIYRRIVVPIWVMLTDYAKFASWTTPPIGKRISSI